MPSVAVNPPKTPVTKGSNDIAAATLPNVCKMPGPPAPFVPTPLPNIGKSGDSPSGYSTTVKIEGHTVAIKGATFKSMGDIASKATGGGLISATTHGKTEFVAPGSMDVKIQGKNVQLLGDAMTNNGGSPANASTLPGNVQPALAALTAEALQDLAKQCNENVNKELGKKPSGKECTTAGTKKHKCCENAINDFKKKNPDKAGRIEAEVPFKKSGTGPDGEQMYERVGAATESVARSKAADAYKEAKAARKSTKGVWKNAYFGNGGASFKADVIMNDDNGVKRSFDFKFNCADEGTMTDAQKDKYENAGLGVVEMIHVPGHK